MATQEKKLEIWKALSRQMGCPPKDTEEYFQKTEAYYHILEELNSQDTAPDQPPSQRAPMQPRHQAQRGVCVATTAVRSLTRTCRIWRSDASGEASGR